MASNVFDNIFLYFINFCNYIYFILPKLLELFFSGSLNLYIILLIFRRWILHLIQLPYTEEKFLKKLKYQYTLFFPCIDELVFRANELSVVIQINQIEVKITIFREQLIKNCVCTVLSSLQVSKLITIFPFLKQKFWFVI